MAYDDELLKAARSLISRTSGRRGPLPSARIRRSISTSYYAIFHFLLEEVTTRVAGSHNDLRRRRRTLARTLTHSGLRLALEKVRGGNVDPSVTDFFSRGPSPVAFVASPRFAQEMCKVFSDAQTKRHDADYDLNKYLSAADARLLRDRVRPAIAGWRKASSAADSDFKNTLCVLMLLKGQLRKES